MTFFITVIVIYMYNKKLKDDDVQLFLEDGDSTENIELHEMKIICK